eukprot:TRINITY_DN39406_c0_g1_i1.p1 TRINITY_DN39406_c0_g1~~TRINITY_DN39406_c0_g1_i1.p1  ORF type:complete len:314 (+),score=124.01 TRINITY_DN39406_c0_g1_i1:70-1011(+)
MGDTARLEQAAQHIKTAQKKLKKSLTKWTISQSDHDQAAFEYEAAAKIYTFGKKPLAAVDAWEKAAECHDKADNLLFAGRAFDAIALIHKDAKEPTKQADAIRKAGDFYRSDGKPDKFADALIRAARVLRDCGQGDTAVGLLSTAFDTLKSSEDWHLMPDAGRTMVSIHVKAERYEAALDPLRRMIPMFKELEQPHNIMKVGLELVVLQLARKDHILAERERDNFGDDHPQWTQSEECGAATVLLDAFESGDVDKMKEATGMQVLTFLHPDIARLARKLKTSGDKPKKKPAEVSGEAPAAAAVDSDDDLEDLR